VLAPKEMAGRQYEPDQQRWNIELRKFDSWSTRLSYNPAPEWSMQVSYGDLRSPEQLEPETRVRRTTASISHHRSFAGAEWATTLAYGLSSQWILTPGSGIKRWSGALLVESSVSDGRRTTWFGRFEFVGKPGHDLHADAVATAILPTSKLQGGFERTLASGHGVNAGIGGTIAVSLVPAELTARYYGRWAPGFGVFLVLQPAHRM
jgi:hypothetical protein